jgi:hypothetical protein
MWKKSQWRMNDGSLVVADHDSPEDKARHISVSPEKKPKKGQGFELVDEYSDKLADELVDFMNKRDGYV